MTSEAKAGTMPERDADSGPCGRCGWQAAVEALNGARDEAALLRQEAAHLRLRITRLRDALGDICVAESRSSSVPTALLEVASLALRDDNDAANAWADQEATKQGK